LTVGTSSSKGRPNPTHITTRQEFTRELTLLRELAGLSVRTVAKEVGIPVSTAGGYFGGAHLPPNTPPTLFADILKSCGVIDPGEVDLWRHALIRVRRSPGRRPSDLPVPYRGLESFQPEHAEWFHGRERLTRILTELVAAQWPTGSPVVVVGPSGSGKSSLLRAGLIPVFTSANNPISQAPTWQPVLLTPGADPVGALAKGLAKVEHGAGRLIVIDQFEELFTICHDHTQRCEFITALFAATQVTTPASLVVLGMRADFYPQASKHHELVGVLQNTQIVVGQMDDKELRQAVIEPARAAKVDVDDGFVELLMRDLASGPNRSAESSVEVGALPLLSHTLLATWQRARHGNLTIADYQATGGISGAIAHTADSVYNSLNETQQDATRQLFLRLVNVAELTADTRRFVSYTEILPRGDNDEAAAVGEVLDMFVEQRLITVDVDTVNISHEALLNAWPRLRGWIDTDRAGLRIHRRLTQDAYAWRDARREAASLYRGGRLITAREWAADPDHSRDLNALEREFLDASINQQDADERASSLSRECSPRTFSSNARTRSPKETSPSPGSWPKQ